MEHVVQYSIFFFQTQVSTLVCNSLKYLHIHEKKTFCNKIRYTSSCLCKGSWMVTPAIEQPQMTQSEFLNVVMPFKDKLYRLAKRLLISSQEAEDATQEILMKLWARKSMMEGYKNVEAFAMTMTKNFCLDRLKSKQSGNLKLVHSNYDSGTSLQNQLEAVDSVNWIEKIMLELPEQQKMVLQLRDIEEYEYDEIAELLEMNPAAVRVTLSRARKTVRDKLVQKHNYGIG